MNKYLILLTLSFLMISCDGFLDREPLDQLTTENFYKTESDGHSAALSMYSILQDVEWYGKGWMMLEIPSDNTAVDIGRATSGAAKAFLVKAHLTRREFGPARDIAKEIIDSGVYDLMENYADNFELETSDNNKEGIFQIQYTGCASFGTGNAMQAFFAPWGEGITKDADALEYFNKVRARAGLEPLDMINREIMLQERRVEFAFENQRWFDLVRTQLIIQTMHCF